MPKAEIAEIKFLLVIMLELVCCFLIWTLISSTLWNFRRCLQEGFFYLHRLHQIPCSRCVFFTHDYRLKCTVNPTIALSESALGCRDFEPACLGSKGCSSCSNSRIPSQFFQ